MALTLGEANRIVEGAIAAAAEWVSKSTLPSATLADALSPSTAWMGQSGVGYTAPKARLSQALPRAYQWGVAGAGQFTDHLRDSEGRREHGIPSQGGVPIVRDGVLEGACGVGGGTSQEDEDCARAGIAKL